MKTIVCRLDKTTYHIKSHIEPHRVKLSVQEILEHQAVRRRTQNTLFYARFYPQSLIRYFPNLTQAQEVCTKHYPKRRIIAVIGDLLYKIEHQKTRKLVIPQ